MARILALPIFAALSVLASLALFAAFAIGRAVLWGMSRRRLPLLRFRYRRLRGRFGANVFDYLFKFTAIEPDATA